MPRKSSNEKRKCFVSEKNEFDNKDEAREKVCRNLSVEYEFEGHYYCLLHYPNISKTVEFKIEFETRLKAKDYSFIGIFFPYDLNLMYHVFKEYADFFDATFVDGANFGNCIFEKGASFSGIKSESRFLLGNATFEDNVLFTESEFKGFADFKTTKFLEDVGFESVEFNGSVDFSNADFGNYADFSESKFSSNVKFENTKFKEVAVFDKVNFSEEVNFSKTVFEKSVFFNKAVFEEKSQTFFQETAINETIDFGFAIIKGFAAFEGTPDNHLFCSEKSLLDLQNARIQNPERLSFHSVRLQPNWFINVDCRKFVFISCVWRKPDEQRLDTRYELEKLKERKIANNYSRLCTKTPTFGET